ncbi:hypothetical protein [Candidatus Lokiarchaeum ossiferum]|uniref:hypothetical protein n=1 Tax=Candidatus Lokiarchaeum ossiferum TaxID=2951803 RepID=UPI00352E6D41
MGEQHQKEEIEAVYISILSNNTHPFEQAVSRSDVRSQSDSYDIARPHQGADRRIERALKSIQRNHLPKLLPLLGEAGAGKTHYYWILKDQETPSYEVLESDENPWAIIYVPSPPMALNIPLHILTCLIDDQGEDLIVSTALNLFKKFKTDINSSFENVKNQIVNYYGGLHSDVIRVLLQFIWPGITQEEKLLSKRWLFADNLTKEELTKLKVKNNIENDDVVLNLLHIIDEYSGRTLIYFFDEMELIYRMFGAESEIKLWEIIKKLFNESRNSLFLTTCLLDVWERVTNNLDSSVISRFEPEIQLQSFNQEECHLLFASLMEHFWKQYYLANPPNPYFPLSENIINFIYTKSKGNPRQIIKLISKILDQIILEEIEYAGLDEGADPQEVLQFVAKYSEQEESNKYSEPTPEDFRVSQQNTRDEVIEINQLLPQVLQPKNRKAKLSVNDEEYFVEINPTSIISALMSLLNKIDEKLFKNVSNFLKLTINSSYDLQGVRKNLALLLELPQKNKKIGIDIPAINKLGNLSKAKAYYSVLDCTNAINRGKFDRMILLLPDGLIDRTGQIISTLQDYSDDFLLIEFSEDDALKLIEATAPINVSTLNEIEQLKIFLNFCFPNQPILSSLENLLKNERKQKSSPPDDLDEKIDDLRNFLLKLNK